MKRLSNWVRDPAWQAAAALIGVIAILVAAISLYVFLLPPMSKLTVQEISSFDFPSFNPFLGERITLLVDGEPIQSVRVHYYSISNPGPNNIDPEDFLQPIQVSLPDDDLWEFVGVETTWSSPPDVGRHIKWDTVLTNVVEMEPTIINRGDKFDVAFILSYSGHSENTVSSPILEWDARVRNLPTITHVEVRHPGPLWGLLNVRISHYGWNIVWLLGLSIFLFIGGIQIGSKNKRLSQLSSGKQIFQISLIMLLSLSTSEIVVDFVMNRNRHQPLIAWVLIPLHVLLVVYLMWPSIKNLYYKFLTSDTSPPSSPSSS